jgi:hypothetical protein
LLPQRRSSLGSRTDSSVPLVAPPRADEIGVSVEKQQPMFLAPLKGEQTAEQIEQSPPRIMETLPRQSPVLPRLQVPREHRSCQPALDGKSGVTAEGLAAVTAPAKRPSTHGETVPSPKRLGIAVIACCSMPRHSLSLAAFVPTLLVGYLKGPHDRIVLPVPFGPPAAHVVPFGAILVEQRSG